MRIEAITLNRRPLQMLARVLSIALLVAQFGAQAHAYSHLSPDRDGIPSTTQSCATCLSFAPVTGAVGASAATVAADACLLGDLPRTADTSFANQSAPSSYQSRAPPSLL